MADVAHGPAGDFVEDVETVYFFLVVREKVSCAKEKESVRYLGVEEYHGKAGPTAFSKRMVGSSVLNPISENTICH